MRRSSKAIIAGLLAGMVGAALFPFGHVLEERLGLELLFKLRGKREAPSDVIIVALDRESSDDFQLPPEPEKWPRSLHARLTEILANEGAAVIAFDIVFDEARSTEHDNLFAKAIEDAGNVVLCDYLKRENVHVIEKGGMHKGVLNIESLVRPIPLLARSAVASAPFPLPKVPVKVSQYWTFKAGAGDTPTLPIVAFQVFALDTYDELIQLLETVSPSEAEKLLHDRNASVEAKNVGQLVRALRDVFERKPLIAEEMLESLKDSEPQPVPIGNERILRSLIRMYQGPDSRYLNFYGPPGTITTVPYCRVLRDHEEPPANRDRLDFSGKALFVGLSGSLRPEQKDGFHTVFSQPSGLDLSGVEIAATAFANLLEDIPVQPIGLGTHLAIVFSWGVLAGLLCLLFPNLIALLSITATSAIYLLFARNQFQNAGIWYPLVLPLFLQAPLAFFGTVMWKYLDSNRERQKIRKAFEYFLPEKVVDDLAENVGDIRKSSQIVYGTCLCTDAEQYTSLAEPKDPKELLSFMNRYYEIIFEPVKQYGGIVSDVKGDSMLAIWATTYPDTALRNQACLAALDIANAVHRFKQSFHSWQLPTRIGLHSGRMVLGTIGAIDHYEYRPVGDIVNTASRLEGLNKYLRTTILVSEEVLYQLDGFLTREVGGFLLAGKSKPIVVHELICHMEDSNEEQRSLCAMFERALRAYRRQCWGEAIEILFESRKIHGGDGPSLFYLKLCEHYRKNRPDRMWNGAICLNKK